MPDNFIISFDGGNEHHNACLIISTKSSDGTLTILHTYHNKEAIHIWYIIKRAHLEPNIILLEDRGK